MFPVLWWWDLELRSRRRRKNSKFFKKLRIRKSRFKNVDLKIVSLNWPRSNLKFQFGLFYGHADIFSRRVFILQKELPDFIS